MLTTITKGMTMAMVAMCSFLTFTNWGEAAGLAWLCATSGWIAAGLGDK